MKNTYRSLLWTRCVLPVLFAISIIPAKSQIVTNGLVSWWQAEGNGQDSFGGNPGTPHGGVSYTSGEVGQAFRFNGVDSYIEVPDSDALRLTNEISVEFWVRRHSLDHEVGDLVLAKGGDWTGNQQNYAVSLGSGEFNYTLTFLFAGGNRHAGMIADTNWHHCAVVARNGDVDPTFYIDGVQQSVTRREGVGTINLYPSTRSLHIGSQLDPVTGWYYYGDCSIDELRIYNRLLSAEEVQTIYDATQPPSGSCVSAPNGMVSWWRGEGTPSDVQNINTGTLENGATFGTGIVGQAFRFDGIDDFVRVDQHPSLRITNQLTIEFWMKPDLSNELNSYQGLVTSDFYGIEIANGYSGGPLGVEFFISTDGGASVSPSSFPDTATVNGGGAQISAGEWHHVAGTYDGSKLQLYIDGQPWGNPAYHSGLISPMLPDSFVTIGAEDGRTIWAEYNGPRYFKGLIDEPTIYHRALSAQEILAIFNAGADGKCPPPFVPQAPSIVSQPISQTNYIGTSARFTVQAIGDFPLHYQWLFNSAPLSNQNNSSLVIPDVQLADAGDYSVIVTNSVGSITSAVAMLNVKLPPPCTPPPPGLVSWWRFENNLLDSWDANDGFSPNASFVLGRVGAALDNSTSAIRVMDSPSLHLTNSLTLEAWIKPAPTSGKSFKTIIAKTYNNPAPIIFPPLPQYPNFLFPTCSFILGTTNNALFLSVLPIGSVSTNVYVVAPNSLPEGQWSHVAATYDGSALRLYVNGHPAGSLSYSNGIATSDGDLGIGGITSGWQTAQPFPGTIDEPAIYNRALSADEIESIYLADLSGKCLMPPSIVGQPLSQTGALGEDVRFSIGLQGTRPFRYQWRFNETDIPGATNVTLLLENLNQSNAGFYSVSVANPLGNVVSTSAQLKLVPAPECVPAPDGLISWWPMDDSGLDVISGNNLQGGLSFCPGKVGDALGFTNRAFQTGVWTMFNSEVGIEFLSIEAWIKAESPMVLPPPKSLSLEPILSQQGTTSPFPGRIQGYTFGLLDGHLAFQFTDVPYYPFTGKFVSGGPDLRDGSFHHVAVTMNNEIEHGGTLYVDGIPVQTFTTSSNRFAFVPGRLFVGSRSFGIITGLAGFSGKIDELAIYNRPLTTEEIAAIAHAGRSGKCKVPPSIITHPADQIVAQGSNTSFVVVATGTPALKYQWLKQGAVVPGATNASLNFTNVQSLAAGLYSVRVTNAFGSTISSNSMLTVEPLAIASSGGRLSYKQSGSQWDLKFTGTPGQTYKIQASTNLVDWTTIGTATDLGGGNFEFVDPDWKSRNTGFYRIVQP